MNPHYLYLAVDLAVLSIPLACSFDHKVRFVSSGRLVSRHRGDDALFIPWDIAFTEQGIWGFNPDYLSGIWVAGIPLEEWLFFLCIACLFTYESLKHYIPNPIGGAFAIPASALLAVLCAGLAAQYADRWYIGLTCALTALLSAASPMAPPGGPRSGNGTTACGSPTCRCSFRSSCPTAS